MKPSHNAHRKEQEMWVIRSGDQEVSKEILTEEIDVVKKEEDCYHVARRCN